MRASIIVIISVGRGDRTQDLEAALALSSREMGISVRGGGGAARIFNGTYSGTYRGKGGGGGRRAAASRFIFINIKLPPYTSTLLDT